MTPVLTKTTSAGKVIVSAYEPLPGAVQFSATLNGQKLIGAGGSVRPYTVAGKPEITHVLTNGKTAIGLTATEAAILEQARENVAMRHAASSAGRLEALLTERRSLVAEVRGLEDEAAARKAAAFDAADERYWIARADDDTVIAAARVALATFDAAHPEVIEHLRREHGARVERNAWM